MKGFRGGCHCGDVQLVFSTCKSASQLPFRTCSCTYCTRQGARYVSDPEGTVAIELEAAGELLRYRFGTGTADFVSCSRCGVFIAAMCLIDGREYAVINANAMMMDAPPAPPSKSFDGESEAERMSRRGRSWTPVESAPTSRQASPPIHLSIHLSSSPPAVHAAVREATDGIGTVAIESRPPLRYAVRCADGTHMTFHIERDGHGGSDLRFVARDVASYQRRVKQITWQARLLRLKARLDFGIDLVAQVPNRTSEHRYVDAPVMIGSPGPNTA